MYKVLLIFFTVYTFNKLYSQTWTDVTNTYINNPSFENNDTCDGILNHKIICNNWYAPTLGTSDWLSSCSNPPVSSSYPGGTTVPDNFSGGYQIPFDGNSYVGFFTSSQFNNGYYTEYIESKLKKHLKPNKLYKFSYRINLGNRQDDTYTKNIGACFHKDSTINNTNKNLSYLPQINSPLYINDTLNWKLSSGIFKAIGDENFLTIGNFEDSLNYCIPNPDLDTTLGYFCLSYYYIDSLKLMESEIKDEVVYISMPNIFTPNDDNINDIINFSYVKGITNFEFLVYNRWGDLIYKSIDYLSPFNGKSKQNDILNDGVYFYVINAMFIDNSVQKLKGTFQLIR